MVVVKGVALRLISIVLALGMLASVVGIAFGHPTGFFWVLLIVFTIGLIFVKETYRHLK